MIPPPPLNVGVCRKSVTLLLVAIGRAVVWLRKKERRSRSNGNDEKATDVPVWNSEVDGTQAPGKLRTKCSPAELHAQPMPSRDLQASRYREASPDEPVKLRDVLDVWSIVSVVV